MMKMVKMQKAEMEPQMEVAKTPKPRATMETATQPKSPSSLAPSAAMKAEAQLKPAQAMEPKSALFAQFESLFRDFAKINAREVFVAFDVSYSMWQDCVAFLPEAASLAKIAIGMAVWAETAAYISGLDKVPYVGCGTNPESLRFLPGFDQFKAYVIVTDGGFNLGNPENLAIVMGSKPVVWAITPGGATHLLPLRASHSVMFLEEHATA